MSVHATPTFAELGLDARLCAAVDRLGFTTATPIQVRAIPALLSGRDVVGRARTGSGKTAAFGLPLLERLDPKAPSPQALILAPTRELALQVSEALRGFAENLRVRITTVYGGAPFGPQFRELKEGADVVVGTPGRILDHLDRGTLVLDGLRLLVLDEADEMLRMGFIDDVERILAATPTTRQVALFSATMPPPIRRIAHSHLRDPLEIQVESEAMAVDHIEQRFVCVPERHKADALARILALEEAEGSLVFSRTRVGCAGVADVLAESGPSVDALHGDLPQAARERVLMRLRAKRIDVLVATDVAARGIDVDHLGLVVNYDLPADLESYVHRIGRTGRAGRDGKAISLVTPTEMHRLKAFERRLGVEIAEMRPPSEADIARARWARLRRDVVATMAETTPGDTTPGEITTSGAVATTGETTASGEAAMVPSEGRPAALERTLAELQRLEASPEAILAAALLVAARGRGLSIEVELDESPPEWARRPEARKASPKLGKRERRPESRGEGEGELEIFLPIGKRRGVRPADLVGALAGDLGVAAAEIGRITVLADKSFVRLPPAVVAGMLRSRARLQVRGTDVPIAASRRPAHGPSSHAPIRPSRPRAHRARH